MAKDIKWIEVCDPCNQHHIPNAEASEKHVIAIDGRPAMEVDVCPRDEAIFQEFVRLFVDCGREIPPPVQEAAPPKKKAKAVKAAKPKELEPPAAEQAPDSKPPKAKLQLVCPLAHPSEGGGKRRVSYVDRSSHTDQCHNGMKAWEIEWEDPDGILKVFCTEGSCKRYGFTSERGFTQHVRSMHNPPADNGKEERDDQPEVP